ncbi:hypothetical protein L209DRAFT_756493, partial [Thermothelomyces heterothallicus CBS 203.75]
MLGSARPLTSNLIGIFVFGCLDRSAGASAATFHIGVASLVLGAYDAVNQHSLDGYCCGTDGYEMGYLRRSDYLGARLDRVDFRYTGISICGCTTM